MNVKFLTAILIRPIAFSMYTDPFCNFEIFHVLILLAFFLFILQFATVFFDVTKSFTSDF